MRVAAVVPSWILALAMLGCSLMVDLSGIADAKRDDAGLDGPSSSDAGGDGAREARDARAKPGILCGTSSCTPDAEVCCELSPGIACAAANPSADGGCRSSSWASCSSASTCAEGSVCCAVLFPSGSVYVVRCMSAAECAAQSTDAGRRGVLACDPADAVPCPPGAGTCAAKYLDSLLPYACE